MARATTKSRIAAAGGRGYTKTQTNIRTSDTPGVQTPQPKPNNYVEGPPFKNSQTLVRPDGVTEVLGPGGGVLEEIGVDGKMIVDPIKDARFDPKNPPPSIQALRDEFRDHVESGRDEAGEAFFVSDETKAALNSDGLGSVGGAFTKE